MSEGERAVLLKESLELPVVIPKERRTMLACRGGKKA
jgi:hypothetical protein